MACRFAFCKRIHLRNGNRIGPSRVNSLSGDI